MARKPTNIIATPLVLDFDGTLQHTDLFWEGFMLLIKTNPAYALYVLALVALRGKTAGKLWMMQRLNQPLITLPWDTRVLAAAKAAEASGQPVYVATGSAQAWVEKILRAQGLNWPVFGTDASGNLISRAKAAKLTQEFGAQGFIYAGNSRADVRVWPAAQSAWVANASPRLLKKAHKQGMVSATFVRQHNPWAALATAMRPHQWLKNLLLFVPLLASHQGLNLALLGAAVLAFVAFSLAASGAYVWNDLLDIEADRTHPRKHKRPLASGALPILWGLFFTPLLLAGGLALALFISPLLALVLGAYVALTFVYSGWLKHLPVADAATLATLWGLRLLGGAVAVGVTLSHWLGLFGFLLFFSLALLKRYTELLDLPKRKQTSARGYAFTDAPLVAMQGLASGMLAVLVVALYLNSPEVLILYPTPLWLAPVCPLLVWWLGRVWLLAHRGLVNEDPIVFAATDKPTWVLATAMAGLMLLASGAL